MIIAFAIEAYKQRVMDEKSWLFDNNLIVMKLLDCFSQPMARNRSPLGTSATPFGYLYEQIVQEVNRIIYRESVGCECRY